MLIRSQTSDYPQTMNFYFFVNFSRQRYVLGDSAMKQMANSAILIYGMGGLGIEIGR